MNRTGGPDVTMNDRTISECERFILLFFLSRRLTEPWGSWLWKLIYYFWKGFPEVTSLLNTLHLKNFFSHDWIGSCAAAEITNLSTNPQKSFVGITVYCLKITNEEFI